MLGGTPNTGTGIQPETAGALGKVLKSRYTGEFHAALTGGATDKWDTKTAKEYLGTWTLSATRVRYPDRRATTTTRKVRGTMIKTIYSKKPRTKYLLARP